MMSHFLWAGNQSFSVLCFGSSAGCPRMWVPALIRVSWAVCVQMLLSLYSWLYWVNFARICFSLTCWCSSAISSGSECRIFKLLTLQEMFSTSPHFIQKGLEDFEGRQEWDSVLQATTLFFIYCIGFVIGRKSYVAGIRVAVTLRLSPQADT